MGESYGHHQSTAKWLSLALNLLERDKTHAHQLRRFLEQFPP